MAAWLLFKLGFLACIILCEAQSGHSQSPQEKQHDAFLAGMQLPSQFEAPDDCLHTQDDVLPPNCGFTSSKLPSDLSIMRVPMKHRDNHHLHKRQSRTESLQHSVLRDASRMQGIGMKTLYSSSLASSSQLNGIASIAPSPLFVGGKDSPPPFQPPLMAAPSPAPNTWPHSISSHVESGVTLGSGEYFIDVYMGTPPKHFMLIIDTGSDLVWTQCNPCKKCYEQEDPIFTPNVSSSYRLLTCTDPQCKLVYNVDGGETCSKQKPHSCRYSYWYGDKSNTTGDLALETITFNLGSGQPYSLNDIVFGCGHSNEGLFKGAGGLLGLGKGPLSFPSQLHGRFGRKFSYCLVNRNSNLSISSTLTFGEDEGLVKHPHVQYTGFVKHTYVTTFYYLSVAKVSVGGEDIAIPATALAVDKQGQGGTIIDSGTTLTYFVKEVYEKIAEAFDAQVEYPKVGSSLLDHCYNMSGHRQVQLPTFSITFEDGAVLSPPLVNYFIEVDADPPTLCLAILEAPIGSPSILGNYLQQNIHLLYDLESQRLGFAPMECSAI
ncbi:hypothetical protein GOP47_0009898 [Adiantum capillus-veneris]|uniref:Peptidase A1 domain-containing protein n=1 Tax=Adiantum capillus-veneris TaxID=13818 RepID=A0A9D4UYL9_ADICA|nr:hypothetical protein GOP47_0009898 [Adiantum capillus-veneris]